LTRGHVIPWLLILAIGAHLGCARRSEQPESLGRGSRGSDDAGGRAAFTVCVAEEPDQLVPPFARTEGSSAIWEWILPSLIRFDRDTTGNGRPSGDLAVSWQQEDGGRAMRFVLDGGRFWEDTTQVSAADVVTTYGLYRDPERGGGWASHLEEIASVEGSGDGRSVLFRYRRPLSRDRALELAALPCISSKQWEAVRDRSPLLGEPERPVHAAGPFRIEEWRRGEFLRLAAHAFPPDDRVPRTQRIILRFVPSGIARGMQVEQGVADVAIDLPVEEVVRLRREAPGTRVVRAGVCQVEALAWNLDDPIWGGFGIRNAGLRALDAGGLRRAASGSLGSSALPCPGFLPIADTTPEERRTADSTAVDDRRDRSEPSGLLTAADSSSWSNAGGDGSASADSGTGGFAIDSTPRVGLDLSSYGPPSLELLFDRANARRERVAVEILLQLRRSSVPVRLVPLSAAEVWSRIGERRFQAVLVGWWVPAAGAIGEIWGSRGSANVSGLSDPSADSLLSLARSPAADTMAGSWERLERRGRATLSYAFVERRVRYDGLAEGVTGYTPSPMRAYGDLVKVERLRSEPQEPR
jgi:hypothetical protein